MAETFTIPATTDKAERYAAILPQLRALMEGEENMIANLANLTAALKHGMSFFWVGFYIVNNRQLVLGPFQGPVACTRIDFGKGVCGTSWREKRVMIVPDVDQFPGHIACSSESKSEIVVPVIRNGEVILVLDVDSDRLNDFDQTDAQWLERIVDLIP